MSSTDKASLDSIGPALRRSVRVVSSANLTLSGLQTIDGVSLNADDRVLAFGQTTSTQDGIYEVSSGGWARAADLPSSGVVWPGMLVAVSEGTTNADTLWMLTNNSSVSVGSADMVFVKVAPSSGGGGLTDGDKGDITVGGSGTTLTVDNSAITLAKMANLAQDQVIMRVTASTGVPETATITAAARTVLDDANVAAMRTTLGADAVTSAGTGLTRTTNTYSVNASQAITTLSTLTTNGYVRTSGSAGTLNVDTPTQVTAALNAFTSGAKGLAPASGGGTTNFLRADGTWAAPPGGGSSGPLWYKDYMADQLLAVGTSWPTTAMADSETYNLVNVIAFDPTTAQGRGLEIVLPTGATTITLDIDAAAAASGFTTNNGIVMALDCRQQYSSGSFTQQVATAVTIADNATIQRKQFAYTVSGLSATAGTVLLCELERLPANASDTMTQDWRVAHIAVTVN